MKTLLFIAFFLITFLVPAQAKTFANFDGLKCGSDKDFSDKLIGRRMDNGPVMATEEKYKALKLKDLGADEPENGVTFIVWSICGQAYVILEKNEKVIDARRFSEEPGLYTCTRKGEAIPYSLHAILASMGKSTKPNVKQAFDIDYSGGHFLSVETKDLVCNPQ